MPAILTENFFMDNERECKDILMNLDQRKRIIEYHVEAILEVKRQLYSFEKECFIISIVSGESGFIGVPLALYRFS